MRFYEGKSFHFISAPDMVKCYSTTCSLQRCSKIIIEGLGLQAGDTLAITHPQLTYTHEAGVFAGRGWSYDVAWRGDAMSIVSLPCLT